MEIPENIRARIAALDAMAKRGTKHEALTAAAMLASLLQKYGLEETPAYEKVQAYLADPVTFTNTHYRKTLYQAATKANDCQIIFAGPGKAMVVGREHNIKIANYMYEVFDRAVLGLAEREYYTGTRYRNSFKQGVANGLYLAITKAREEGVEGMDEETRALVIRKDEELQSAMKELFPNMFIEKRKATTVDPKAYARGKEAAESIKVHSGLETSETTGPALLA